MPGAKTVAGQPAKGGHNHNPGGLRDKKILQFEKKLRVERSFVRAACRGNIKRMGKLLGSGISREARDYAFICAVQRKKFGAVKLLAGEGVDVNAVGSIKLTSLFKRVGLSHLTEIEPPCAEKVSVWHGRHLCTYEVNSPTTLLTGEAERGKIAMLKLLIGYGASVDTHDEFGTTALMYAIRSGYTKPGMVKFLLKEGANPNLQKPGGTTALITACTSHSAFNPYSEAKIRLLLSYGADPNIADEDGRTAVYHLCIPSGAGICRIDDRMLKLLVRNGADINAMDEGGLTVLDHATAREKLWYGWDLSTPLKKLGAKTGLEYVF